MKKLFLETTMHFQKRCDLAKARQQIGGKKLWRITAIEMKKLPESMGGGYQMGSQDHFTVSAYCKEMAIGAFCLDYQMCWFVTDVVEETVIGA